MAPAQFWRTTLAEWRGMVNGHTERLDRERRQVAWSLSYQLVAAGCNKDSVTVAKLLGEEESETPTIDQSAGLEGIFSAVPRIAAEVKEQHAPEQ